MSITKNPRALKMASPLPQRRRVLTVGDGDLSYSLALSRAFGDAIELTATTFLSEVELQSTYARAADNIATLRASSRTRVLFSMDACSLHDCSTLGPMDDIFFNHPQLGLADLNSVQAHARRHRVLIAHFLASATALMPDPTAHAREGDANICGRIHLTLCGTQPTVWAVEDHARQLFGTDSSRPALLDVSKSPTTTLLCADTPPVQAPDTSWWPVVAPKSKLTEDPSGIRAT